MPLIEGEWYQVVFRANLAKWPKVPEFPELSRDLLERIVMGSDVVVYAQANNALLWEYGYAGPFIDAHFQSVEKMPSLTTSTKTFCKATNGVVHMLFGGRTEPIPEADAAALKAFL